VNKIRSALALSLALGFILGGAGVASAGSGASLAAVRQATDKYHDLSAALADGYVEFYVCTEQPGVGTMGQHLLNTQLLGDDAVDPLRPEVLVYQPTPSGKLRLGAVEYLQADADQDLATDPDRPYLFGLPFDGPMLGHAKHAWIWQGNPNGIFADWNPSITCLGTGDNGG